MSDERRRKQMERMVAEEVAKRTSVPWWQRGWTIFMALVSLAAAYVAFYPRPVITPSDTRDANQPFRMIVALTNNNILPLEQVTVTLEVTNLRTTIGLSIDRFSVHRGEFTAKRLSADDRLEIDLAQLAQIESRRLQTADVKVIVNYQPWFIPWTRTKEFFYKATKMGDGSIRLMAVPAG
jgi:hypothetical protein